MESEITLRELKKKKTVISLGGGAFLNKSIRALVKKTSVSFWLDVNVEILAKRLKNSQKRPLLYKKNISDTIEKMYLVRKKIYIESDFRIKCDSLDSKEIVDKILKLYENAGN